MTKTAVSKWTRAVRAIFLGLVFVQIFSLGTFAQKKAPTPKTAPTVSSPKVTQIDETGLKNLLKPSGKPLLVNFWATWCDPCREEFPDLVKIDVDYKGKIDFITISIDFPEEINTTVPKFLREMKAEMPAYLLATNNEDTVISSIAKSWAGGMPFTILYQPNGETAYIKEGKVKPDILRAEIEKALSPKPTAVQTVSLELQKPRSTEDGVNEARKDIANGILRIQKYGFSPGVAGEPFKELKDKYNIEIINHGCLLVETPEYYKAYNETMKAEIEKRFGEIVSRQLPF